MIRVMSALSLLALMLSAILTPASTMAQTDTASVEDTVLSIVEGEGWNYALDSEEQPITSMVPMMIDGEPQLDFAPVVLEMYQQHQMIDAYAWSADLVPDYYEPISTSVEIRVLTFADEQNAIDFQDAFYNQLVELTPEEENLTEINPLPESDLNILGITSMTGFTDYATGESMGSAGSVRYLAQIDNTVISVEVIGPFVDYNFDIAYWLLDSQATCVTAGTICDPVTMPTGDGRWQLTERGIVFFTEGDAENEWARWIFPLEAPVTAPEWSVTLP